MATVGAHVEVAGAIRAAEPLLSRGRVEVAAQGVHVDGHGAESLRAVQHHRRARRGQCRRVHDRPRDPGDVRAGHQPRLGADVRGHLRERDRLHAHPAPLAHHPEWRQDAGVLLDGGQHLVAAPEVESREHRVDPVRGRPGEGQLGGVAAEEAGHPGAQALHAVEDRVEEVSPGAAVFGLVRQRRARSLQGAPGHRTVGARIQVRHAREHGELGAKLLHRPGY